MHFSSLTYRERHDKLNFDYYKNLLLGADWCSIYKMTGTPNLLQWQVYKYVGENVK